MKKNLKKLNLIITFILFLIFAFVFWNEYIEFHKKQLSIEKNIKEVQKEAKNFEVLDIKNLENTQVYHTPYPKLIDKIVENINSAKQKVYLEVYIFTEKRIIEALKNAKKRSVEVKVILEKNPYLAANINNKTYEKLKKSNIDVVWSNSKNFNLNHSKFFIIDKQAIISTWNISYSSFKFNRDFFVFIKDKNIVETLENIFLTDFSWEKKDFYHPSLVISPNYSRAKIEKLLLSAKTEIKIYMQYLKDENINNILQKLKKSGINIQIIINKRNLEDEEISLLKKNQIEIKALEDIKMHSKVIIVDKKYMFIWSENFSSYSLDKNREVWVLIKDKKLIEKALKTFNLDWKKDKN